MGAGGGDARAASIAIALALSCGAASACSGSAEHPLDRDGAVGLTIDVTGPLFAAPPPSITARQRSSANVSVSMFEQGDPARGGYVDVHVEPSGALGLYTTDGTCKDRDGVFRCVATDQGFAGFRVQADDEWTTPTAKIFATWSDQQRELDVTIDPPGLTSGAQIALAVGGAGAGGHVLPTFRAVQCTTSTSLPSPPSSGFPAMPRVLTVRARAEGPPGDPTIIANAPVLLEASTPEAQFASSASCSDRASRVTLLLDDSGQTPLTYVCLSDVGGSIDILATSGQLTGGNGAKSTLAVDAEPYWLRVLSVNSTVVVGQSVGFDLAAYDVLRQRMPILVRASIEGTGLATLPQSTFALVPDVNAQDIINATSVRPGAVHLSVAPDLSPGQPCTSPDVQIVSP